MFSTVVEACAYAEMTRYRKVTHISVSEGRFVYVSAQVPDTPKKIADRIAEIQGIYDDLTKMVQTLRDLFGRQCPASETDLGKALIQEATELQKWLWTPPADFIYSATRKRRLPPKCKEE